MILLFFCSEISVFGVNTCPNWMKFGNIESSPSDRSLPSFLDEFGNFHPEAIAEGMDAKRVKE